MMHDQQPQQQFIRERLHVTCSRRSMSSQPEPSRKRRRIGTRVWFPSEEVMETSPSMKITQEEWDNLWYQNEDISIFRKDALNYIAGNPVVETRGLERFQSTRAKEKTEARRCTIKAYRKGIRGDKLAEVVQIFTSNARSEAFVTGCNDYCEAYHPEMKDALIGLETKFHKQQDETDSNLEASKGE
mmetsp:Transcript_12970/g.30728  ORF Transcript_12970/g.30728 Transcript_12970/m.30728 type:complete len:186 (+) Transcript_12970:1088-1645(+)